jgi:LysR family transcriptional regulator, low CO2-responsive transcriptional regulator
MRQGKIRRYVRHGTLPQFRVFHEVIRHGSYTRAAEELNLAQPTVSVQIRKLTETVGMPLLEQVGKRVQATEAGRALHAACEDIFETLSSMEDRLSDLRGLKSGSLHIATGSMGACLAPRLLAEFMKAQPGIEIALQIKSRKELLDRLARNMDDLYIFANPPEDFDVVVQRILPNPLVAFARTDHPLANQSAVPFSRFAEEPMLMREPGSGTRMVTERIYAAHGLKPRVRMELSSNEAIREAMLSGLGVSVLSRHSMSLAPGPRELAALQVEGFPVEAYSHFVYPIGKPLSMVAQSFMQFTRDEAIRIVADSMSS